MYYPHYKNGIRYTFTLQCSNQDHQLTLSLHHDGTVRGDIHYYDVCKVADSVTIAYNQYYYFDVDPETLTMVEYPMVPANGWYSNIPYDWEIIKTFLDHFSLTPTWIDCHRTWSVGKVRNCNLKFLIKFNSDSEG